MKRGAQSGCYTRPFSEWSSRRQSNIPFTETKVRCREFRGSEPHLKVDSKGVAKRHCEARPTALCETSTEPWCQKLEMEAENRSMLETAGPYQVEGRGKRCVLANGR